MAWLCEVCGYETENHTEYKLHVTGHRGEKMPEPELGQVGQTATGEVIQREIDLKASKTVDLDKGKPEAPWSKGVQAKIKAGIKLEYKFSGVCPNCGMEVETLELPNLTVKDKIAVVAYCVSCKQQLQTEVVAKL